MTPTRRPRSRIDFSRGARLDEVVGSDYDRVAEDVRGAYSELIDKLGDHFRNSLCWWLETPAARNQRFTRLFHDCIVLALLCEYRDRGELPVEVVVDSRESAAMLRTWAGSSGVEISVNLSGNAVKRRWEKFRDRISPLRTLLRFGWNLALCKIIRPGVRLEHGTAYTLIDTFILPGFETGDRYYPGLLDQLAAGADTVCLRVPEVVNFGPWEQYMLYRHYRQERTGDCLFKETVLGVSDWLACIEHWWRRTRLAVPPADFMGQDLSGVVKAEIASGTGFRPACQGLMNYRFAKKLAARKMDIRRVIDWWENQPLDKGWNLGFRKYFPAVDAAGYNGMHGGYLAIRPLESEYQAGVLPSRIAVMGSAYVNDRKEFCDRVRWEIAPAFWHQWLWESDFQAGEDRDQMVLVSLTIDRDNCRNMVAAVNEAAGHLPEIRFMLKAHPMMPLGTVLEAMPALEPNCQETKSPVAEGLRSSRVLICSGHTTVALEGVANGNDVILFGEFGRGMDVPNIRGEDGLTFDVSHNGAELVSSLRERLRESRSGLAGESEMARYFAPLDPQLTMDWFLGRVGSTDPA